VTGAAFQEKSIQGREGSTLQKSACFVRLQAAQASKGFLLPAIQQEHSGSN